jgi:Domain of unknown function (DUF4328)
LVGFALISVVAALAEFSYLDLLNDIKDGKAVSAESLMDRNDRVGIVFIAYTIAYLACVIAFLAWFHRAYRNLPALGAAKLRYKVGWSIGAWFIPFFNLVRPKQIANDIWRGTDPGGPTPFEEQWNSRPVAPLLHWWWGIWVFGTWLGWRAASLSTETVDDDRTATIVGVISDLFDVVTALVAVAVVRAVTRRYQARAQALRR